MCFGSRNSIRGFALRTRTNLEFITHSFGIGEDVHVVTQLAISLLGLVVFPAEYAWDLRSAHPESLETLTSAGWPEWNFEVGESLQLGDLLYHIRNATAHRRIVFSSESRLLKEVEVTFSDRKTKDATVDYWRASINGAELLRFAIRFTRLLEEKY